MSPRQTSNNRQSTTTGVQILPLSSAPNQTNNSSSVVHQTFIMHANNLMGKHRDMATTLKTYEENISRLEHSEFVFITNKTNKIDHQIEQIRNKISQKSITFLKWDHEHRVKLEVQLHAISQTYRLKISELESEFRTEKSKCDQDLQDALLKSQSRTLGGDWQELIDPSTQSIYYLNTTTGHSQWYVRVYIHIWFMHFLTHYYYYTIHCRERPAEINATADEIAAVTCVRSH